MHNDGNREIDSESGYTLDDSKTENGLRKPESEEKEGRRERMRRRQIKADGWKDKHTCRYIRISLDVVITNRLLYLRARG